MLTRNHRQEAICRSYVQAVAALAGVSTSTPVPDYGVDLSVRNIERRGARRQDSRVQIDLQLRATTRASLTETQVRYDLDVDTYHYLREASQIRCLLVVLVLPEDEASWLTQSQEELIVRNCAYWHSLRGAAAITASSSVRVAIPRTQVFSAEAVRAFLTRLSQGDEPC